MMLGDLGAEVIKVERPGVGDDTRRWGPPFTEEGNESAYFLCVNRNKKSITIDLKKEEGVGIVEKLVAESDVLVENYLPGKLDSMGLGYDRLKEINPGLIYVSISGYGPTGPYAELPGYDVVVEAMGGIMAITGTEDVPCKIGVAMTDLTTGLYAKSATLAALIARGKNGGLGQKVDCSLLESQVASLANIGQNYLVAGMEGRRVGTGHESIVPYQGFHAEDGQFLLCVGNDKQFKRMAEAIGMAELAGDEKFKTNPARVANRDEIVHLLSEKFATESIDHWLALLGGKDGVPCAPINPISEVFKDPQVHARDMVQTIHHPTIGNIQLVGPAVKYSETPAEIRLPPPLLGQHTDEVLNSIVGLEQGVIDSLRTSGVL
eukprot:g5593.t1